MRIYRWLYPLSWLYGLGVRLRNDPAAGVICKKEYRLTMTLRPYRFKTVSLKEAANLGFRDEVAGDGKGGWTDQGPNNDMRSFPVKQRNFAGVEFDVTDPEANGGKAVTPHFGLEAVDASGNVTRRFEYPVQAGVVSEDTSEKLRYMLEQVVENGGGHNGYVEGYRVGGKTATSQTFPRGTGRYIASFLGFAPADDPKVLAMAIITNPQGTYYGGQVAAPVVRQLFENILPYLEDLDYNIQHAAEP